MTKYKTVYTLWVKEELRKLGFDPVLETDNLRKPGFKCWVYEISDSFLDAFEKITGGK